MTYGRKVNSSELHFNALFRDTPLGHVLGAQPNSQIAKLAKYSDIWLFGYLAARQNYGQWGIPEKSIKNVAQRN